MPDLKIEPSLPIGFVPDLSDVLPAKVSLAMTAIVRFLRSEDGPTAVEYAVMLAMILIVVIAGISAFGNAQANYWGNIQGDLESHGI